ncbi:MAG: hypothetical protein L6V81_09630 [Clostridium sp.]|nr:MAG: hypothetical protein L6V81_09630 [Clostridium sp.]
MLINELTDNDVPGSNLFKEKFKKIIERIILESPDLVKDSTSISFCSRTIYKKTILKEIQFLKKPKQCI